MTKVLAARPRTRIFAGSPHEVQHVRRFVGQAIAGCPVSNDVVLLASELATNAIMHTASGMGGTFTVSVSRAAGCVRVEVADGGSAKTPAAQRDGSSDEAGRGLRLVEGIAARWGYSGGQHGRVVWFEAEWK